MKKTVLLILLIGSLSQINAQTSSRIDILNDSIKIITSSTGKAYYNNKEIATQEDADFYNVSAVNNKYDYTPLEAHTAVPENLRKPGMVITYSMAGGGWTTERFIGATTSGTDWTNDANWQPVISDNNYTNADKTKVGIITTTGNGSAFLSNDGTYKAVTGGSPINLSSSTEVLTGETFIGQPVYARTYTGGVYIAKWETEEIYLNLSGGDTTLCEWIDYGNSFWSSVDFFDNYQASLIPFISWYDSGMLNLPIQNQLGLSLSNSTIRIENVSGGRTIYYSIRVKYTKQ